MVAPTRTGLSDGTTTLTCPTSPRGTLPGLHIIGEAAKTFVSPARVGGILARVPQTAQCFEMHIFEMLRFEALSQRGLVELRIMARAGLCGPMGRAVLDELVERGLAVRGPSL